MLRILIVDSSTLIIDPLEELLTDSEKAFEIYKANTFSCAKKIFEEMNHDVVLMDANLPGKSSIELLKEVKRIKPNTSVIVLGNLIDQQKRKELETHGVKYFLDKYHEFEKIPELIKALSENN